jgi:hypothetical protein
VHDGGVNDVEGSGTASQAIDTAEAKLLRLRVVVEMESIMQEPLEPLLWRMQGR